MKTIWIDLETTGLDYKKDTIIEFAALYENDKDKSIFHKYCKPESYPENFHEIEELTGIKREFLEENGISESELYNKFIEFASSKIDKFNKTDKAIFAAYNATFDDNFLRELFIRNNDFYYGSWFYSARLDIMSTIANAYRFGVFDIQPSNKCETIAKALNIKLKAHSAIEDIKAARQIQIILEHKLRLIFD